MRERTDHKSQPVRHSSPRLRDDIGSPYLSPFDALTLAQGRPLTNHSSLLTSHGRASGPGGALPGSLPCILTRRFAFGVLHFVLVLVVESGPADQMVDRMNPYRHTTITTAAFLFVMFVLLVLGPISFPLQDEPWLKIRR